MALNLDSIRTADYALPTRLPPLYGNDSWLSGAVILESPVASSFGCEYSIGVEFTQTEEQNALTESIIQQAQTQSYHGLRAVFKEGSDVHNRAATAFVSLALTISANILYEDEDGKKHVIHEGKLIAVDLPEGWQPVKADAEDLVKFAQDAAALLRIRNNTLFTAGYTGMVEYDKLDALAAEAFAAGTGLANMDDEDEESSFAATPVSNRQERQNAELAKIGVRFSGAVNPSKKSESVGEELGLLRLSDLAPTLVEMFGNKDASALLQATLEAVGEITSFLPEDAEDDVSIDEEGEVEEGDVEADEE
jgi:hypothetical protein